jgi:mono/diheme cytochrome c family protein
MTRVISLFLLSLFLLSLQAQNPKAQSPAAQGGEYGPAGAPPASSSFNNVVPLPSSRTLSSEQLAGKKLFIQRCSVCHLPGNPAYSAIAPMLDGKLLAGLGDGAVRNYILHGSAKMPGFQYTLEQAEVEKIIAYLKLLAYDPTAKKYSYNSSKK